MLKTSGCEDIVIRKLISESTVQKEKSLKYSIFCLRRKLFEVFWFNNQAFLSKFQLQNSQNNFSIYSRITIFLTISLRLTKKTRKKKYFVVLLLCLCSKYRYPSVSLQTTYMHITQEYELTINGSLT